MKCMMLVFVFMAGTIAHAAPMTNPVPPTLHNAEAPATVGRPEMTTDSESTNGALINSRDRRSHVSTACRQDREIFCRKVKGASKIKACLDSHYDQLSDDCKALTKVR